MIIRCASVAQQLVRSTRAAWSYHEQTDGLVMARDSAVRLDVLGNERRLQSDAKIASYQSKLDGTSGHSEMSNNISNY